MGVRAGWFYPVMIVVILAGAVTLRIDDPLFMQTLRALSFDVYQRLAPAEPNPDPPVRVVAIDAESIDRIGPWPWPPAILAGLVDGAREHGAAVVAFDLRLGADSAVDPLTTAVADGPTVSSLMPTNQASDDVLPLPKAGFLTPATDPLPYLPSYANVVANAPAVDVSAAGIGATLAEEPATVRRLPLADRIGDIILPSLPMEVLRVAQGASEYTLTASDQQNWTTLGRAPGIERIAVGDIAVPTDPDGGLRLRWRADDATTHVPAWRILANEEFGNRLGGRIAMIGVTAPNLADLRATPLEVAVPVVSLHAQAIEYILSGQALTRPLQALPIEIGVVVVVGIILALVVTRLGLILAVVTSLTVVGLVLAGGWYAYRDFGLVFDPSWPALTLWMMAALAILYLRRRLELRRRQVRAAFGQTLAPQVVRAIIARPDRLVLDGEARELTVMFGRVRNFGTVADRLETRDLIAFVNRLNRPVMQAIGDHRGTVARKTGEIFEAFWNAPLDDEAHADNACRAAIDVASAARQFGAEMPSDAEDTARGAGWLAVGLGIASGNCAVGNLGTRDRFDYVALGAPVDLSERLQRRCAVFGVAVVIADSTARLLSDPRMLELDLVRAEGRARPVRLFTLAAAVDGLDAVFPEISPIHAQMIARFRDRDWAAAEQALAACRDFRIAGLTTLYSLYRARIATFREIGPPPDWDGADTTAL
ncbi:CHASE2 domain-containing protein [Bauldia sp.]|uniref:CHASE2 domain-containing protein n=1 Tax=Bauldia sp. TaxID=2575872 RepID=UPI003BA909A8